MKGDSVEIENALKTVVEYLWDDEMKDYGANDKPKDHIFRSLMVLNEEYELGLEFDPDCFRDGKPD